jgi:hypothetical protein
MPAGRGWWEGEIADRTLTPAEGRLAPDTETWLDDGSFNKA